MRYPLPQGRLVGRLIGPTSPGTAMWATMTPQIPRGHGATTVVHADGAFEIPFLAPGPYVLSIGEHVRQIVQVDVQRPTTVEVSLPPS